jgi:hypothetical protein
VGLLMAPAWRDALLSFSQLGPMLLSTRFLAKAGQHLTAVTAYAPTNAGEDATKDAFYLMLFACLKEAPASDKLIVIGISMRSWVALGKSRVASLANSIYIGVRPSHRTMVPACLIWPHLSQP